MQHFEDSAWVDFVRGVAEPAAGTAMAAHMVNCRRCAARARVFSAVVDLAAADIRSEPHDHVVQAARAIFALRQPEHVSLLSRLQPAMKFDSFRSPQLEGVRGGQPMSRQMLYEAGSYSIDLRLDHERGSRRVWLVGQIASSDPAAHPVGRLSVALTQRGHVAAEAFTNTDGEFQLEYEPHPQLQLRIDVRPDALIELPLASQNGDSVDGGRRQS